MDLGKNEQHEIDCMKVLLKAVCFYRDACADITPKEYAICCEQEGALRANLYGEDEGWRSVEEEADYRERQHRQQDKILDEILEAARK